MVPVILMQRRIPRRTGTRILLSRIFVPSRNREIKTRDNPAVTTPAEALPEGVGAGGSDYKGVSTKYPGAHLKGYWKVWENFKVHPRVVLVLKQGYCLPFKQKPPLTRFPAIKSSYSSPVKQKALLESVQQMVQKRAVSSGSKQELSRILHTCLQKHIPHSLFCHPVSPWYDLAMSSD